MGGQIAIGLLILGVGIAGHPVAVHAAATEALQEQVTAIFQQRCSACHGPAGVRRYDEAKGGFDYVLDLDRLAAGGKLINPGDPQASKLFSLVSRDKMPYGADTFAEEPVPDDEKAVIHAWIASLGQPQDNKRALLSDQFILDSIAADLAALPAPRRRQARHVTLTHLFNAGEPEDRLEVYRQGVGKLFNSLTWESKPVIPQAIDADATILRVFLDELGWSGGLWTDIATFDLNELNNLNNAANNFNPDDARSLAYGKATPAAGPDLKRRGFLRRTDPDEAPYVYLKADWFAFVTSRPPLYHDILEMPFTLNGIEKFLDVDRRANIKEHRVARAGMVESGVGLNNRLVERHDAKWGAYWLSYDFGEDLEDQDLLRYPLGPYGFSASFRHDGGEAIFNLPNGLQAYLLVTDEGFRIDKAPINIVQDATHPTDSTIINGASCFSCHADGMNAAKDEVCAFAQTAGSFTPEQLSEIEALYPPDEVFQPLLTADRDRFHQALRNAGIDPALRDPQGNEPITALIRRFERPLDLKLAAAEFGLDTTQFLSRLDQTNDKDLKDITARLKQANLPRNQFITAFSDIQKVTNNDKLQIPQLADLAPAQEKADKLADLRKLAELTAARREPAIAPVPDDKAWLVQLASGQKLDASEWDGGQLKEEHAALIGELAFRIEKAKLDQGTFYRIQFGPLDNRNQAKALCERLESADQACLVVQPQT